MDLQPAGVVRTFLDTLDLTLTLYGKAIFSHGLTDVPGEGHIGITNDLVLQTSNYTANR